MRRTTANPRSSTTTEYMPPTRYRLRTNPSTAEGYAAAMAAAPSVRVRGTIVVQMPAPAPASTSPVASNGARAPLRPEPTHPCVRCGRPVTLDESLCEECNPLGLSQPATSQAHGTVFLAIILAVVALAVAGRLAIAGVGPFRGEVSSVVPAPSGLAVTLT